VISFISLFPAVPLPTEITAGGTVEIILGRGAKSNNHGGNKSFRKLVKDSRPAYREAKPRVTKRRIAQSIFVAIEEIGGRFLKPVWTRNEQKRTINRRWIIIEDKNALKKIKQSLQDGKFKWIK
jgi:hypothetical protein